MYAKEYVIVYNGELYNTDNIKEELIEKGYTFDTTSDTEVILKGYIEFKEKILDKMEGIFAFAVYNKKTKELFLARDRFGIKPLYYLKNGDDFVFASMLRAILKSEIVKPYLSKKSLGEILALGPSKKLGSGIFTGIDELRAAHYMYVRNRRNRNKKILECRNKKVQ